MLNCFLLAIQRTAISAVFCLSFFYIAAQDQPKKSAPLFSSDSMLHIQLKGQVKQLLRDRDNDNQYHDVLLIHGQDSIPLKARTRGKFRKNPENCSMPPLLLNFPKSAIPKQSVFAKQDKLKLVLPCLQGSYVVREYLAYKAYEIVAPVAFQTRLVSITINDESLSGKTKQPFIGFLIEADEALAKRIGCMPMKDAKLTAVSTQAESYFSMVLFQFMIGNTDWSVDFEHNILLAGKPNERPYVVPFDFDQSGLVDAPYATPSPELPIQTVQDRLYRGVCHSEWPVFMKVAKRFLEKETVIRAIFTNAEGVDGSFKKMTSQYLDLFFEELRSEKNVAAIFASNCNAEQKKLIKNFVY